MMVLKLRTTPMTSENLLCEMPRPAITPPIEGLDDVTKGYVPKLMSNMVAFAPSTRMVLPCNSDHVSAPNEPPKKSTKVHVTLKVHGFKMVSIL